MDNEKTSEQETGGMKKVYEHQQNKKLISSELGDLYSNYLGDSLFTCVFEHHLTVVEDDEVKDFLEFALRISRKHINSLEEIYAKEQIPKPVGFGEQDLRKDAPGLFSDLFMVFYVTQMAIEGLTTYASALSSSSREDIVDYFKMCLDDTVLTYEKGSRLLLSKGKSIYPPSIPYPKQVDFVENASFISLLAGKDRPLTSLEIKHLQLNINTNILGKALMLGFSQVASSDKVRKYFQQGAKIADRQIREMGEFLMSANLPTPSTMDAHITDSTTPPFSDKLMLYHTSLATGIGIQNYGMAVSKMMRHDLHGQFALLTADIAKYANKGLNLIIDKGWLEEPPTAPDRQRLSDMSTGDKRSNR
ncbi:DUF3231 family protein [Aquibacillus kalidii]|uniref:DUF3231 family protein n=1 Tax=Aquibacillus kalidii TaxID=2762597 RepID=UPI002E2AA9D9|nr:DUF3231 family protein [Aquibacillus kalidii]